MNKPLDMIDIQGRWNGNPLRITEAGICPFNVDGVCPIADEKCRFGRNQPFNGHVLPEFCPLRQGPVTVSFHEWYYDQAAPMDHPSIQQRVAAIPTEDQIDDGIQRSIQRSGNPYRRLPEPECTNKFEAYKAELRERIATDLHDEALAATMSG